MTEEMKKCSLCEVVQPTDDFWKNKNAKDGLQPRCKACQSKKNKEYYWSHKEESQKRSKIYHEKNRERLIAVAKKWQKDNPERSREYQKRYYQANKEKVDERCKKWVSENRERVNEGNRRYYEANKEAIAERRRLRRLEKKEEANG